MEKLRKIIMEFSGMSKEEFAMSVSYWQLKSHKKGEFYHNYKSVCRYLGFILDGVVRIYRFHEQTGVEKNMNFFTSNQFMSSFKNNSSQQPCDYYAESMTNSEILYIRYDHLQLLYKISPAWERFGRMFAESSLRSIVTHTESVMFKSHEERYVELIRMHPDIFNSVPLYHIASYLGIEGPSLSRIRKRMAEKDIHFTTS
jgi:CRP-like cAMP-binding protein